MPKRKNTETPVEQFERFKREVERLIAAGELSPTDADAALEKLMTPQILKRPPVAD